jgi:hypothetical protein
MLIFKYKFEKKIFIIQKKLSPELYKHNLLHCIWVNLHDIVECSDQSNFTLLFNRYTQQWNYAFLMSLELLRSTDGKNTFYYKFNLGYFVQSSYWYLKKWICWHVHYHHNCSTNPSIYSITSIVRVTLVSVSPSPQKICCSQGRFYVGYRIWLNAYVCMHTCLTSITVLSFSVLFVYSCVSCDQCMHFNVP